ncbi:MAG: DnaJ domain-containing protein [Desulfobacterales bacterium]|nr:DnaJ domain-containing protein [Desulfobacterales bacterium]MDX2511908.1 DnaJ domain-containing protein [Desulfobacterales bacterium]
MKLVLSLLALVYFLLPYDFFPDVILGWGWIDDLVIIYFLWRFFYRGKGWFYRQPQGGGQSSEHTSRKRSPATNGDGPNDPYDVLQIPRGASQEEIKTAYKHLAGKYHPDKVIHLGEEFQSLAEVRFKEIQTAYQKLSVKGKQE